MFSLTNGDNGVLLLYKEKYQSTFFVVTSTTYHFVNQPSSIESLRYF